MPDPTVAAEDVLPGHPDRLCDAIAEAIVETACRHDPEALVGVEVALHRHLLVVTGRVAAGRLDDPIELGEPVAAPRRRGARARPATSVAGRTSWTSSPTSTSDRSPDDERAIRRFSDDQGIAVGHADPTGSDCLPVEAAAARPPPSGARRRPHRRTRRARPRRQGARRRLRPTARAAASSGSTSPSSTRPGVELRGPPPPRRPGARRGARRPRRPISTCRLASTATPCGSTASATSPAADRTATTDCPARSSSSTTTDRRCRSAAAHCAARTRTSRTVSARCARGSSPSAWPRHTGQAATVQLGWLPGLEAPDRLNARLGRRHDSSTPTPSPPPSPCPT